MVVAVDTVQELTTLEQRAQALSLATFTVSCWLLLSQGLPTVTLVTTPGLAPDIRTLSNTTNDPPWPELFGPFRYLHIYSQLLRAVFSEPSMPSQNSCWDQSV